MLRRILIAVTLVLGAQSAQAACGGERLVQAGETILALASDAYGSPEQWTLIYYANPDLVGADFALTPGVRLRIPCPPGQEPQANPTPLHQVDAELTLVTGSNFAPFTDINWPGQGMVTELVHAALEMTPDPVPYAIAWENDWSQHLSPLLLDKQADMGFPSYRPDCAQAPNSFRCANFHFSDPLIDVLMLVFVRRGDGLTFGSDRDFFGKTLCRPKGFSTHDLDQGGRDWVRSGHVTLVQPITALDCFDLLMAGEVDAVTVNIFSGAQAIDELGLRGQVIPLERPLSSEGLHVVIPKTHWRGTTHLYRINAGLQALRQSDRYNEIVSRHLDVFWDRMTSR